MVGAPLQDVYTGSGAQCGAPEPNGCNENQGRAYVFSGENGSLLRTVDDPTPQANALFGAFRNAIAADVNGDGSRDFVVMAQGETVGTCDADFDPGTPPAPCPSVGAAYEFSGKDGTLIRRIGNPGAPIAFAGFGQATSDAGDVTQDGAEDIVIGATSSAEGEGGPRAFLFSGKTGGVVRELGSAETKDVGFGFDVGSGANPGDVNGDGVRDLYGGAVSQDLPGLPDAGRVYLLSGADGSLIRALDDPHPMANGLFGFNHASAGDLNGDGTADLLVMRFVRGAPNTPGGAAYVFDGRTGALLSTLPGMRSDGPGNSLASPGDVNRDGYPDFFLGGPGIKVGANGEAQGQVIVELSKAPPEGVTYQVPAQPSSAFPGCPASTANVIRGKAASDRIAGTAGADRIFAGAGADVVDALAGNDCVDLGSGPDRGQGGRGADLMLGAGGNDRVSGNSGNDRLSGGSGRDRVSGGSGGDRVSGNSGSDRLSGGSGRDRISGGSGNDRISARDGKRDRVNCGSGRDRAVVDSRDRVSRNCERVR